MWGTALTPGSLSEGFLATEHTESTEWLPYGPPALRGDVDCGACRNDEAVGRRGGCAGRVLVEEARTRGGARPRARRYLDGRMHLMG